MKFRAYLFTLFLSLTWAIPVLALNQVFLETDKDGATILRINGDRQLIDEQISALQSWSNNFDHFFPTLPEISENQDGTIEFQLKDQLPTNIAQEVNTESKINGPNCWNTSLRSVGILSHKRFTSDEELKFWLGSKFCRELKLNEKATPGDIVAMRTYDERMKTIELHAMIYISPLLAYSKDTSSAQDAYLIAETNDVYHRFRFDHETCKKIYGKRPKNCYRWANFFHCQDASALKKKANSKSDQLRNAYQTIESFETLIENMVLDSSKINPTELDHYATLLTESKLQLESNPKINTFWKQAALLAIKSSQTQIRILKRNFH